MQLYRIGVQYREHDTEHDQNEKQKSVNDFNHLTPSGPVAKQRAAL
jgi:hypothetical protein